MNWLTAAVRDWAKSSPIARKAKADIAKRKLQAGSQMRAGDRELLERECSRSRCVGGCVCADTWDEVNRLRDVREEIQTVLEEQR